MSVSHHTHLSDWSRSFNQIKKGIWHLPLFWPSEPTYASIVVGLSGSMAQLFQGPVGYGSSTRVRLLEAESGAMASRQRAMASGALQRVEHNVLGRIASKTLTPKIDEYTVGIHTRYITLTCQTPFLIW
jgi:hypothetical protein